MIFAEINDRFADFFMMNHINPYIYIYILYIYIYYIFGDIHPSDEPLHHELVRISFIICSVPLE